MTGARRPSLGPMGTLVSLTLATLAVACASDEPPADRGAPETDAAVEIVARGLTFDAPDSIPFGWTTLRFRNESDVIHFAVLERLPDGIGIAEQQEEVAPVFQVGAELLAAGDVDAALQEFGALPTWFGDIVFKGGPGFTSAGRTSEATVNLEPGTYLIECYVKTGGTFHSFNPDPTTYGMVRELIVTDVPAGTVEPAASLEITLSSARGIEVDGVPTAGMHTVAVRFEDQVVHENFVGHDVHLARLTENTDLDRLLAWIDWTQPGGLEVPEPAQFVGGTNEVPAGETAYFTVVLEPGRYAWISEVSNAAEKQMVRTFDVAGG